jgi:PAS domain S-box-containing protein
MTKGSIQAGIIRTSAARYADFLESLPVAIYRITVEGEIIYCNQAFAQLFGYQSIESLIGTPVAKLHKRKKDHGTLINAIAKHGRVCDLPLPFYRKDRSVMWCAITGKAVLDDDGVIAMYDGSLRDITAQIEDKTNYPRLDDVADDISEAIIFFDLEGYLIDVNRAAAKIIGIPKKHLTGKPITDFIVYRYQDLFHIFLSDVVKSGQEEGILVVQAGEKEMKIEFQAFLVKRQGRAHHIKAIARDVTEKVNKQHEQSKKERFQGVLEMAGGVAHRFNQPLTIVNNILNDVLSGNSANNPYLDQISAIQVQIEKMNEITRKIGNIKTYEPVDYVAGVKIVDIDKAS